MYGWGTGICGSLELSPTVRPIRRTPLGSSHPRPAPRFGRHHAAADVVIIGIYRVGRAGQNDARISNIFL